jgi:hypothetical protein
MTELMEMLSLSHDFKLVIISQYFLVVGLMFPCFIFNSTCQSLYWLVSRNILIIIKSPYVFIMDGVYQKQ